MGTLSRLAIVSLVACGSSTKAPDPPKDNTVEPPHDHSQHAHHTADHKFSKAEDWVPMFDDPARDAWQKPDNVVKALAIQPDMTVADIGAGTGYFEARLAKAVGASGKVLAIDIEPDMVRYLAERARRENTPNVYAQLAKPDDPQLDTFSIDRILIVDTWHHINNRVAYSKKLAAALKPKGFVLVVDFTLEAKHGPPAKMRLTPEAVMKDLEAAGLKTSLADEDLPDQYIVKAERAQ